MSSGHRTRTVPRGVMLELGHWGHDLSRTRFASAERILSSMPDPRRARKDLAKMANRIRVENCIMEALAELSLESPSVPALAALYNGRRKFSRAELLLAFVDTVPVYAERRLRLSLHGSAYVYRGLDDYIEEQWGVRPPLT